MGTASALQERLRNWALRSSPQYSRLSAVRRCVSNRSERIATFPGCFDVVGAANRPKISPEIAAFCQFASGGHNNLPLCSRSSCLLKQPVAHSWVHGNYRAQILHPRTSPVRQSNHAQASRGSVVGGTRPGRITGGRAAWPSNGLRPRAFFTWCKNISHTHAEEWSVLSGE